MQVNTFRDACLGFTLLCVCINYFHHTIQICRATVLCTGWDAWEESALFTVCLLLKSWGSQWKQNQSHAPSQQNIQSKKSRRVHRVCEYNVLKRVKQFLVLSRRETSLPWSRASQCIIQLLFQHQKAKQTKFFTVQATLIEFTANKSAYQRTKPGQNPPLSISKSLKVTLCAPPFKPGKEEGEKRLEHCLLHGLALST